MGNSMFFMDMLCLAAAVAVAFMGYKEMREGKLVGRKDVDKYTEESQKKLAQKEGPLYMGVGAVGVLASLSGDEIHVLPHLIYWPALGVVIIGIILDAILIKKTLVKKDKFTSYDLHKKLK